MVVTTATIPMYKWKKKWLLNHGVNIMYSERMILRAGSHTVKFNANHKGLLSQCSKSQIWRLFLFICIVDSITDVPYFPRFAPIHRLSPTRD